MNYNQMPKIDLDTLKSTLTKAEFELVKGIVATRGKNKGCLRASKPKIARKARVDSADALYGYRYDFANDEDANTGKSAYIWRMVAFFASPLRQHQCMPCTCDFDLPGKLRESHVVAKELDQIVDKVLDTIPVSQQHGLRAWGQAFGMIGTPRATEGGAIVYR